ncbi:hypothetical protein ACOSQ4_006519 [Xanthoceras sorbifolium]
MSNMAKLWSTFHTAELSLLAAIVFYANSLVMICDHFLIYYQFTMMITLLCLTCFFLIICDFLIKGNQSFQALYWNFFFLMTAYLSTSGDSKDWSFSRGFYSLSFGFTILVLYTLYAWINIPPCQGQDQQEQSQSPPGYAVPLIAEISFLLMCNGIALMGRCCFFHSDQWMLVGGGLMFLTSAIFFSYYYLHSSVKPILTVNLHKD